MENVPDTHFIQDLLPEFKKETGIDVEIESISYIDMHSKLVPQLSSSEGSYDAIVVDFLTPETEHSMWYFWGMARNFNPRDKALTAAIREGQGKIFGEDLQMLESQQRNLLARPDRKLLSLNIDAGGVHSRRIIERIVAEEAALSHSAAAGAQPAPPPAATRATPAPGATTTAT